MAGSVKDCSSLDTSNKCWPTYSCWQNSNWCVWMTHHVVKLLARNRTCLYSRQQFANMLLCRSHTPIWVCQHELANIMHGSILPVTIPPRATPGTSPALRARGWGIVWNGFVPGVGGRGKSKITSRFSCEARHLLITSQLTQWRQTA